MAEIKGVGAQEYLNTIVSPKCVYKKIYPENEDKKIFVGAIVPRLLAPLFSLGVDILGGKGDLARSAFEYWEYDDRKYHEFVNNPKEAFYKVAERLADSPSGEKIYKNLVDILFELGEKVLKHDELRKKLEEISQRPDAPTFTAAALQSYGALKDIAEIVKRLPAFKKYVEFLYKNGVYTDPINPLAEELGIALRKYAPPAGAIALANKVEELGRKEEITIKDVRKIAREVRAREKIVRTALNLLEEWRKGNTVLPKVDVGTLKTLGIWEELQKYLPEEERKSGKVSLDVVKGLPPEVQDRLKIVGDLAKMALAVERKRWNVDDVEHVLTKLADFYAHVAGEHENLLGRVLEKDWMQVGGNLRLRKDKYEEVLKRVKKAKDRARLERVVPEL